MVHQIKLSGITRLEDARYASAVGADFLSFVQKPNDARAIDLTKAKEIIEWVVGPKPVGVFENESVDGLLAACQAVGFQFAQLDGNETAEDCKAIQDRGIPVIKTLCVRHDASTEQLRSVLLPYRGYADYIRLDVSETSLFDDGGESVNWRVVKELATEFDLFLAGAITAENLEYALTSMRPYAIDVSSSIEESPGVLDFDKLGALFDAWNSLLNTT